MGALMIISVAAFPVNAASGVLDLSGETGIVDNLESQGWIWDGNTRRLTLSGADAAGIILPDNAVVSVIKSSHVGSNGVAALRMTLEGEEGACLYVDSMIAAQSLSVRSGSIVCVYGSNVGNLEIAQGLSFKTARGSEISSVSGGACVSGYFAAGSAHTLTAGKDVAGAGIYIAGEKVALSAPGAITNWYRSDTKSLAESHGGSLSFDMPAADVFVCTLTMTVSGAGTAAFSGVSGLRIALTATPAEGETFLGWSGENVKVAAKSNPVTSFAVPSDSVTVNAAFSGGSVKLTTVAQGGRVELPSGGFKPGDQVKISAVADPGWSFSGWSADRGSFANASSASTVYTVPDRDAVITASFKQAQYVLTVICSDAAGGSVGITSEKHFAGDKVDLAVKLNENWSFTGWTAPAGSFSDPANPTTVYTMPAANVTVMAQLLNKNELNHLSVRSSEGGKVVLDSSAQITSSTPYNAVRITGSTVRLTAVPDEGSVFLGWTASYAVMKTEGETVPFTLSQDSLSLEYKMTERSVSFIASFAPTSNTLDVRAGAGGSASFTDPDPTVGSVYRDSVSVGKRVILRAVPDKGCRFAGWELSGLPGGVDASKVLPKPNEAVAELVMPNCRVTVTAQFLPDDPDATLPPLTTAPAAPVSTVPDASQPVPTEAPPQPTEPERSEDPGDSDGGISWKILAVAAAVAAAGVAVVIHTERRRRSGHVSIYRELFAKYNIKSLEKEEVKKLMEKNSKKGDGKK